MFSRAAITGAFAVILSAASASASNTARGLAWATDNAFAPTIGSLPLITWYHHWALPAVPQMPSKVEYYPMFWGASQWDAWNSRKSEMAKKLPTHLMGFNEPDISSQANMSPSYAAQVWMQEIHPYGQKGVSLGSPAIAYSLTWMASFLADIKKQGGYVNFLCIHWYGSWNDLSGFQKYVESVHQEFNMNIWITELGITTASNPSQAQVKSFMEQAYTWMDSTGYVTHASWFGCFEASQPPDGYATGKNALFKAANALSDMAYYYGYTYGIEKRAIGDKVARHNRIAAMARDAEATDGDEQPAVHCDELCELRNAAIKEWEDSKSSTQ